MNAFGDKVADLRKERGLTVKEICQQVGIPQSRLSELESPTGRWTPNTRFLPTPCRRAEIPP